MQSYSDLLLKRFENENEEKGDVGLNLIGENPVHEDEQIDQIV